MDLGDEVKLRWVDDDEWRLVRFDGYDLGFMVFIDLNTTERLVARSSSVEILNISDCDHS